GEHGHALRSRERGCFLVVQTVWAEKLQSTTDAGSLNTFGRNEIEVAPISSALLRIACLVILYKAITATNTNCEKFLPTQVEWNDRVTTVLFPRHIATGRRSGRSSIGSLRVISISWPGACRTGRTVPR